MACNLTINITNGNKTQHGATFSGSKQKCKSTSKIYHHFYTEINYVEKVFLGNFEIYF